MILGCKPNAGCSPQITCEGQSRNNAETASTSLLACPSVWLYRTRSTGDVRAFRHGVLASGNSAEQRDSDMLGH